MRKISIASNFYRLAKSTGLPVLLATLILTSFFPLGNSVLAESDNEQYHDSNFQNGIYFHVEYPGKDYYLFAGNNDLSFDVHQWKNVKISAEYRYQDEKEKIHYVVTKTDGDLSVSPLGSSYLSLKDVKFNGTGHSATVFTKKPGRGKITYTCKSYDNEETISGSITINVRSLTIAGDSDTLMYAALSMLSYSELGYYAGRTVNDILIPSECGGAINAGIGAGNTILKSDQYRVFADERDFITTCAGDCRIIGTRKAGSFYAVAFSFGSQMILAYRGTNGITGDLLADINLGLGQIGSNQFSHALNFYKLYGSNNTVLTGHSLGGGLANYVSVLTGTRAVTFNAPSTMVTAVSNFLAGAEDVYNMGRNYMGLNDGLRTDYVNKWDWVGKVGVGDSSGHLITGSSNNLMSGNLDPTVYKTRVFMNRSGLHFFNAADDHGILRIVYYNNITEKVCMSANEGLSRPDYHDFTWNSADYFFGSTRPDTISSVLPGNSLKRAYVFSGNGNDTINLHGYASETVVSGKGNDTIYASSGNSTFYYYPGHGNDNIYDSHGKDKYHVQGFTSITVTPESPSNNGVYYITGDESSTSLATLHVGTGTGSFSIYQNGQLIRTINREAQTKTSIHLACPVKVYVYDKSNQLLETIEDGLVYEGNGEYGHFATYVTSDGYGKSITLETDEYCLVIEGTDEGTMKYTGQYYDGSRTVTKSISNVPVYAGAKYYPASISDEYLLIADLDGDGTIDYQPSNQEITGISIDDSLVLYLGTTAQLIPTLTPENTHADLVLDNSNPDVVSISDDGTLTALNAGESMITITALNGVDIYASCIVTVPDENLSITEATVTGVDERIAYTGEPYYPEITVSFRNMILLEGKSYYIEYSDEFMPGITAVTIHGIGSFSDSKTIEYEIYQHIPQTAEEAVESIIQELNTSGITDDYDKAVWLHNWLIHHANYDYTYSYYDADGVLLYHTGVCNSYTLAYQLLLNAIGIENQVISSPEMNHAWNLVKLDGAWCHIDCTWDDPNEGGSENQFYFGMNDEMLSRDHQWNRNKYPSSTATANYYPLRHGFIAFSTVEEMEQKLEAAVASQQDKLKLCYIGSDTTFDLMDAFEYWFHAINWKYGMRGFDGHYGKFEASFSITYTDPWPESATRLAEPVDVPEFSLRGPLGFYNLSNYSNNGIILVFTYSNGDYVTTNLLRSLEDELSKLHDNGIEVFISVGGASEIEEIQAISNIAPDLTYVYDEQYSSALLGRCLSNIGWGAYCDAHSGTFPWVFIINSSGKIIYYSSGNVANVDELISEAYSTATGYAIPGPTAFAYEDIQNGKGSIFDLNGADSIKCIQETVKNGQSVIYIQDCFMNTAYLQKWEKNYSLYHSLGIQLIACFEVADDEQKASFPHVIFVDYDYDDFWNLLFSVDYDSYTAFSEGSFFYASDGKCLAYTNGHKLSLNDCMIFVTENVDYDIKISSALSSIEEELFADTQIKYVDLTGGNLLSINDSAFCNCTALQIIKIPSSVNYIADNAFAGCNNLIIVCSGDSYAYLYAKENGLSYIIR